jgi:hypothetical protein
MNARGLLPFFLLFASLAAAQPLAVRDQGGIKHVSGGVGLEEREALAAMRAGYNVRVTAFVPRGGNYLADVALTVRDAAGRAVLEATMDGPFLFATLSPGSYALAAGFEGKSLVRKFTVPAAGSVELYLPFDDPSAAWEKGMEPERERKRPAR